MRARKKLFSGSLDRPTLAGLGRLLDRLSSSLKRAGVADAMRRSILVVIDELVSNTLNYRAPGDRPHVDLSVFEAEKGVLEVELKDDGRAFDPFSVAPPQLAGSLEERSVGGVGIWLVRRLTREVRYRREGEWNCLWLTFGSTGSTAPEP